MQTFLPYPSYSKSVNCLDYKRLGKQRVEAMQIYNVLTEPNRLAWKNHPAVKMWRGYEDALAVYHNLCIIVWMSRGYNNTMQLIKAGSSAKIKYPQWLGDERLHSSHRANLLRKDYTFYSKYKWTEDPVMEYFWPEET